MGIILQKSLDKMRGFIIALTFVAACSALSRDAQWEEFKLKYKKGYRNLEQDSERKAIFMSNLDNIEAHNVKFEAGQSRYSQEINNLVEVAGLLHLLDLLKVFGPWLETTKLISLNKCWLIVLKEIVMEDGPMMVLIPLSGKEEIALKLIIPTMPPMATPANLSLLLSAFLATISSMFIMKALIPLLIVFTTMDLMPFTYMSTTTGVIITTESLKIPTAPTLLITMPLSM